MRENGEPPWGPTEAPIVEDLLRRIMPLDEPVNLSVGRSRAASMRRSIIPKLRDIRAMAGMRAIAIGGYYDRAAPSDYVNQDQIILCSHVRFCLFSYARKELVPRSRVRFWKYLNPFCRTTTGSTYRGLYGICSRVPRFRNSPGSTSDLNAKWLICYSCNDNRWITHV